jgi:hypothetical protein
MSNSKLRFVITLVAFTGAAFLFPGCQGWLGSEPSPSSGNQGAFFLEFNNKFDQPGDDVGGAKTQTDVPIVWAGSRQLGPEESQTAGDTFNISSTWHGFATDPWYTTTLATKLNPGNWNLSVTVNGQLMTCQAPIGLPPGPGPAVSVTFPVNETGVFIGCMHN